ncbi:MAG: hypothetical protein R3277_02110 [Brumimicrobium sp.]|nr:hypothetical protein [Brumimicrobium sp.]
MKLRLLFATLFLILSSAGFAQRFDYDNNSKVYFGFNFGRTWHSSDVQNLKDRFPLGAGFIFGTSINQNYGNALSFDLRLRYLGGNWYGQDTDTTGMISQNTAVSNIYDTIGFAVQNFKSTQHMLSLELALHFNRFRERTGLDPYIFGGIDLTATRTRGDLLNNGVPYDFASDPSGGQLNNDYNVPLDKNPAGDPYSLTASETNFLPSLGIGLGYYFGPRFSVGFEHKSTFFNNDYFDGTTVNQNGETNADVFKNDIFHYTSVYLRWYLKRRTSNVTYQPDIVDPVKPDINAYTDNNRQQPPVVEYTNPSSSPHTVNSPVYTLRADIRFVERAQDVSFFQEGIVNSNFTFNSMTDKFQSTVQLKPGQNVFRLRGVNQYGSDEDVMVINYVREDINTPVPPVVDITDPSANPETVSQPTYLLKADVKNVIGKGDVSVIFNGQPLTNFNFTPTGLNNFSVNLNLNPGVNSFKITGTNTAGSDSDETTIIYQRAPLATPPIVDFLNPASTPVTVNSGNFNLIGSVKNVANKDQVTFIQNGNVNNNFSFNSGTGQFNSNVILQPGQNIFQLIGTNQAGTDQASVVINYQVAQPKPPVVSILDPASNPFVTYNNTKSFKATVLNVSQSNQVKMTLNGNNYTSFNFDVNTGILTTILPLQLGSNVIKVTGTNSDGTDSKQTTIVYAKPTTPQPPLVEYVIPSSNPHQATNSSQLIRASVQNVSAANQINVNLNGNTVNNFVFNAANNTVEFTASLILGVNTITTTATNSDGTDSETMTVIYRKISNPVLPVITYLDPIDNPATVYSPVYNVKARVKYVSGASDITLKINGNQTGNFTYSSTSEIMQFNTSLVLGANIIEITAANQHGQTVETTSIIYKKTDPVLPPVVTITNPMTASYTTNQSTHQVVATVLNVVSAQNIVVNVNGNNISNFSYNMANKQLQFTMNLNQGNNNLTITATNSAGADSDSRTVIYKKDVVLDPPHVTFTNPPSSGFVVNNASFQMVAEVTNVQSKNDIEVRFNGVLISNNLYAFYPATKEVKFSTNLTAGNNVFQVRGMNNSGTHLASTNVIYQPAAPQCDQPEITFNAPSVSGETTNNDYYDISAVINHVTNLSSIQVTVNGISVGSFMFDPSTHVLLRKVDLMEGNNVVEIKASNDCGQKSKSILIKYVKPQAPCNPPVISPVNPSSFAFVTQDQSINFSAASSNFENPQQIQMMLNGSPVNFSFDLGTHQISANLNLSEGANNIVLIGTNACGTIKETWLITREVCHEPNMNLVSNPSLNGNALPNAIFQISGTISNVVTAGITVQHNGNNVNFVYDATNENFNASINLVPGNNLIKIVAVNDCGTERISFEAVHQPIVVKTPPTVSITTPSSNPHVTSSANQNVVAQTTNISSNNQISVTVNNSNVNFNFNPATGTISFNLSLIEGSNDVSIQVVNNDGTAADQVSVVYNKPVVIQPPVVDFSAPSVSPETIPAGNFTVQGSVSNISAASQLQLIVNGQPFSGHQTTVQSNGLGFSFVIPVNTTHPLYDITAIGTNSAGTDQASVEVRLEETVVNPDPNCMPTVGASFSADNLSATATSTMDLSNVVLKFSDLTTQKFDNLSGNSITLSGTGSNVGKCIVGVWIKSGCNQSGDGPGFGEWVPNAGYDGACESTPCDPPVISLLSNTNVNSASNAYTFQLFVDNVTSNQVSITRNGSPVNCNFNAGNQNFSCLVNLTPGQNLFEVTAAGCETVTQNFTVTYTVPCNPITYVRTFPAQQSETVSTQTTDITLTAQHYATMSVTVNGSNFNNISASGNQIILNHVPLNEGQNSVVISLTNDCSQENINYSITYNAPGTCGPRFNPGNASWQFCLITPSGTYTRDDLANNPNFTYTGPASSLYFMAIAGGGDATVNGSNFAIQSGRYYLFEGNITVSVSSSHPGSMGHWQVCIDAQSTPLSGTGGNRPPSPCETKQAGSPNNSGSGGTRTQPQRGDTNENDKKPKVEEKPDVRTKPTRTQPSRNTNEEEENNPPAPEPRKPVRTPPTRVGGGK